MRAQVRREAEARTDTQRNPETGKTEMSREEGVENRAKETEIEA